MTPTPELDAKVMIGAPIAAFTAVVLAGLASCAMSGTIPAVSAATGEPIPFLLGALLVTLGAFGGFVSVDLGSASPAVDLTFLTIPFIFTAVAVMILFRLHRTSEIRQPLDLPDRLAVCACSGMVLLICSVAAWFLATALDPASERASFSSNVFLLATGSLAIASLAALAGRSSAYRSYPAWSFTSAYCLAAGLPLAIIVCVFLTVSYEWGASSWLLLGNIAVLAWIAILGGVANWDLSLAPLGGPQSSGFNLIIAAHEGIWTIIGLPLGALSIMFATIAWRRSCMTVKRSALPLAFGAVAAGSLVAGTWATGYAGGEAVTAIALSSPFNVAIMMGIGWLIDTLARLGYSSELATHAHR